MLPGNVDTSCCRTLGTRSIGGNSTPVNAADTKCRKACMWPLKLQNTLQVWWNYFDLWTIDQMISNAMSLGLPRGWTCPEPRAVIDYVNEIYPWMNSPEEKMKHNSFKKWSDLSLESCARIRQNGQFAACFRVRWGLIWVSKSPRLGSESIPPPLIVIKQHWIPLVVKLGLSRSSTTPKTKLCIKLLNLGLWFQSPEVECDELCQRVIQQRIADGLADNAPVATDVATFSCPEPVDGFLAGFPCQAQHGQPFDDYMKDMVYQ